ncbi:MAG: hypothetical protein V1876_00760 [Candidatus Peregrinibacteria bacterium]
MSEIDVRAFRRMGQEVMSALRARKTLEECSGVLARECQEIRLRVQRACTAILRVCDALTPPYEDPVAIIDIQSLRALVRERIFPLPIGRPVSPEFLGTLLIHLERMEILSETYGQKAERN